VDPCVPRSGCRLNSGVTRLHPGKKLPGVVLPITFGPPKCPVRPVFLPCCRPPAYSRRQGTVDVVWHASIRPRPVCPVGFLPSGIRHRLSLCGLGGPAVEVILGFLKLRPSPIGVLPPRPASVLVPGTHSAR